MDKSANFSSILVIGENLVPQKSFEHHHAESFEQALSFIKKSKLKLIILTTPPSLEKIYELDTCLQKLPQPPEILVIFDKLEEINQNHTLIALLNPSQILCHAQKNFDDKLAKLVLSCVQSFDYHKQNENFYQLFEEQNQNLKSLNDELKKGVNKRKLSIQRSQKRLLRLQEQLNLMYESMVGIQNCKSISEIEELLSRLLKNYMNLDWTRVLIDQKEILDESPIIESQKYYFIFGSALVFDKNRIGHIYFAKKNKNFTKQQESFLLQVSEIVSIKINQLIKYSNLLITRSQWQETFKAIKYPVVILNRNYDYITSNRSHLQEKSLKHKKCHKVLFDRDSPCVGCKLGEKFEFKNSKDKHWYYVASQTLKEYDDDSENLIHIYQDITEQKNIETQILEKTKLNDLGILTGSLAHELNNPLGGIITYLQVLQDDMQNSDPELKNDINELLNSAIDCKHIIQMILENVRHNKPLSLT